jgi:Fe-Mn family superoxide dismutase
MTHQLPKLKYDLDKLAPTISKQTMELHYGKHLLNYVNTLNNLIQGTKFENASLETIIREADGGIFNNGAQAWNHKFYFDSFSPNGGGEPFGKLAEAIKRDFGSFAEFKEKYSKSSLGIFGSGWCWLVTKADGKLDITQESNAGNPLRHGLTPILGLDVWEHAYYVDYQNRRADHIAAVWNIIDWKAVSERY